MIYAMQSKYVPWIKDFVLMAQEMLKDLPESHLADVQATFPQATVRRVEDIPVAFVGRIAILPLRGMLTQRPTWMGRYGLATSAEQFVAAHASLVADSAVSSIVWDVDSPGGEVAGMPEAADRLFSIRNQKRTVAVSNSTMASAAYWLASAASEVVATPSSLTGSIGVYAVHEDRSKANENRGVRVSYISAGRYKTDGNPDSPLSASARESMQRMIGDYYGQFTDAVARHRGVASRNVIHGFGEGDVLTSKRAVTARLADRVGTLNDVLRSLSGKGSTVSKRLTELAALKQRLLEAA